MIPFGQFGGQRPLGKQQSLLIRLFDGLGEQDQASLLAFAEFLAGRGTDADTVSDAVASSEPKIPKDVPRPETESVVAAIRRLTDTYFMLERDALLNETASLMGEHVMQGRPAAKVVDDLEAVFLTHYEHYRESWEHDPE